jgi:hypothetical protein
MAAEGVPAPQKNAAKNVIHSLLQSQEQSVRFPITFYHYAAAFLFIATVVVAWFTHSKLASSADETAFSDPRFKRHRYRFLLVWGICSSADWLQGPYVWELYHNYGYKQDDIDKLFVIGFVSSMIFGTFLALWLTPMDENAWHWHIVSYIFYLALWCMSAYLKFLLWEGWREESQPPCCSPLSSVGW